ncbi:hypothetical protein [Aquimarina agarilytica]|uniref:hypothetical protein n=1 Tax=Aquimarina agarilytica TaxID=1087449 RepID=UPI00028945B8|nr:hypothetical protein [Aquimarina agarilytica]
MNILASIQEKEVAIKGTIADGFLAASIKNIGNDIAMVNGVSLAVGEAKSYPFVGKGYESIDYDPQNSRLRILEIF